MKPNPSSATALLSAIRRAGVRQFDPIDFPVPRLMWPTRARALFSEPERYIARTRANPDYGKPGWTRDCGRRFHRGLDIAPLRAAPDGASVVVRFSDCATGREYPSEEPGFTPEDDVFAVFDGVVAACNADSDQSDLGIFAVVRHIMAGRCIHTLYAHLAGLCAAAGDTVVAGSLLGPMGRTSRSADARAWMAIAPHLHFEVIAPGGGAYDPLLFLQAGLPRETD